MSKEREELLENFRERYREARKKGDTKLMRIIEIRAKLLKMSDKEQPDDLQEKISIFMK